MTNPIPSSCPKCGVPIPEGAPQGLCPKCVLLGAATEIQSTVPSSKGAKTPTVAEVGAHFPELEVLELLGAGGMGAVYKARQPKLDRFVALKILSSDLAGDPAFAERFDREARVLARLNHPNIVTVFDSGMAGPFAYLMMEFVDGVNLRQSMKTGRFTPSEALTLVQDVCAALKFAHEKGILHRDIKPENILIDSRGLVKIADFGIAKLVGENDAGMLTLTQRGFVLGSPHYMAPEQFESPGDVDQRADIYSLGVVLYELLTGELPLGRFAPPSKKSAVDARIDEIVMRTLERERELRFQTVGEVKTQMEAAKQTGTSAGITPSTKKDQSASADTRVTARFATASSICTAVSFVLGFLFSVASVTLQRSPSAAPEVPQTSMTQILMLVLSLALFAAAGLLGFGFGVSALREIRASFGQKRGFLRAMSGTLAWPVLLVFGLTGLLVFELLRLLGSTNDGLFTLIVIVVGLAASTFLIRRVATWAKGPASHR
ncbi:serine/threonine-protein kinase [Prosthecobacter sp.]|uniref:serine/threonine-protein kinase n=1 Tax=Prosthecobacter sp. TaxID=1965333 RepID=UPI001D5138A6|nr:serine/threonine-protein kinase [Prosthecobacter sp.]MCB1275733.1 protein kinase [Prosthecobacter sp.]